MTGSEQYGQYYWCIKTSLSKSGEIYAMADDAIVLPDGTLSLTRVKEGKLSVNLAIAPGNWTAYYAASLIDGHAVAIEHWDGEISRHG
jgi:hypothetical protein